MKNRKFSTYQSHLDFAHFMWSKIKKDKPVIIDATCGNGYDSLFLAKHCLNLGSLHCIDIQECALEATKKRLESEGISLDGLFFYPMSHETLPDVPIDLIVYNLGYLPGSCKEMTTKTPITLKSVKSALKRLNPGGLVSITCYVGHPEGAREETALLEELSKLCPSEYMVCHHQFKNRKLSPSLIFIYKTL